MQTITSRNEIDPKYKWDLASMYADSAAWEADLAKVKALAEELTEIVHGKEGLEKALRITETFFRGNIMDLTPQEMREGLADAQKVTIADGTTLIDALVEAGVSHSKSDARKLIQQGSISVNGQKTSAIDAVLSRADAVDQDFTILRKGKKNYIVLTFQQ